MNSLNLAEQSQSIESAFLPSDIRKQVFPCKGESSNSLNIVLIHGWAASAAVWQQLVLHLQQTANVTVIDIPSFGNYQTLTQLEAAILNLAPENAVYIGWSLGGQVATSIAANYPERVQALATICSNPSFVAKGSEDNWPGMDRAVFGQFLQGVESLPEKTLRRFDSLQAQGDEQPRQLTKLLMQSRNEKSPQVSGLATGLNLLEELDTRQALQILSQPQLHVLADKDALVPQSVASSLRDLLSKSRSGAAAVEVLEAASHGAICSHTEHLAAVLKRFLQARLDLNGADNSQAESVTTITKADIAKSFSRAAESYNAAAGLQRQIGHQLLEKLQQNENAERVLDLGCGTGYFYPELQKRFPNAQYIGLDLAEGMVRFARRELEQQTEKSHLLFQSLPQLWLTGDAEQLPLVDNSIDLIYSSLAIQWCQNPQKLFSEISRVLSPGGKFYFSTLGPDTLKELRQAWAAVDQRPHVNDFLQATFLQQAVSGNLDMKLNTELIELQYDKVGQLLHELKAIGAHNMNAGRSEGLTTRKALSGMMKAYEQQRTTTEQSSYLPATYEVYYGVASKTE